MKTSILAFALAACVTTGLAHASETAVAHATDSGVAQSQSWSAAGTGRDVAPKTRADVRQELVRAEHDGQLVSLNNNLYRGS
ncbi:MAG: hypothetical protein QOC89_5 [Paraburkholderia sp.]|jgi:hypothetical protein|uniref:DUF4148 domain-containing protein n=1 Tax=Paraburkholderia sp. TaxID=1926495 RepID=UPI002AFE00C0|nr:DUF4148 domain-containing protein [Paraburkholderia sp.]MEA3082308.1 hypothetical protein [Paraburkholderia sp.]MEA3130844.1 hypothetical protein [Paraburkholderia sp.]